MKAMEEPIFRELIRQYPHLRNHFTCPGFSWAAEELKARLNMRLQGVDPGKPHNWTGLQA